MHRPSSRSDAALRVAGTRKPDGAAGRAVAAQGAEVVAADVADIGPCAFALFARGKDAIGQTVGIAGEQLTGAEMAAALSRALDEPV